MLHASQHCVWAVQTIKPFLPETNIPTVLSEEALLSACCSLSVQDVLFNCQFCSLKRHTWVAQLVWPVLQILLKTESFSTFFFFYKVICLCFSSICVPSELAPSVPLHFIILVFELSLEVDNREFRDFIGSWPVSRALIWGVYSVLLPQVPVLTEYTGYFLINK